MEVQNSLEVGAKVTDILSREQLMMTKYHIIKIERYKKVHASILKDINGKLAKSEKKRKN